MWHDSGDIHPNYGGLFDSLTITLELLLTTNYFSQCYFLKGKFVCIWAVVMPG